MKSKYHFKLLAIGLFVMVIFSGCSKTESTTALPAINSENNKPVGAAANDLLSAAKYNTIQVEIQYMPGFQPDPAAINNLVSFLNTIASKPSGINVIQSAIATTGKPVLNVNDIAGIEKANRTVFTSGSSLGVYILITDGRYSDANVLGVAYRNTSICLLGKTIQDNSGGIGQASRTKLVTTVIEHEAAHILGLVDIGSPMQINHKDVAHGSHCNNSNCLMNYAAETTDVLGFLVTGNIPVLDANCRADLQANGGK